MIVSNSGTAPLEDVKMAGTAPKGWEISFDPQTIADVKPNETAQVTAIIKPSKDAVAGDYRDDRALERRQRVGERRPALHAAGFTHARLRGRGRHRRRVPRPHRRVREVRPALMASAGTFHRTATPPDVVIRTEALTKRYGETWPSTAWT